MRELRINGILILAVDHGFGNIKSANTVFSNGMAVCDTEPAMYPDYLYYEGKYYVLNQGHKAYESEKVNDDDFYILTVAAIAKELQLRGKTKDRVHLAVGLPLKWIDAQKEEFKAYLLRESTLEFDYKNQHYEVEICGCSVMPQCYAGIAENLQYFNGLNMIADIGNGTMNVMCLMDGVPVANKTWTEILGVEQCAKRIHDAVLDKFQYDLQEVLVEKYVRTGKADVSQNYLEIMRKSAVEYVDIIFQKLKECGYNSDTMRLYFMGGGARLIELFGDYDSNRVTINHDICANAKGYEYFCYVALKRTKAYTN